MPQITVTSKETSQVLKQVNANTIGLSQNSVVLINVDKDNVQSITRSGDDAVITLKNGEVIVVENYFSPQTPDNSLVFVDDDGQLYWAQFTDAAGQIAESITFVPLDNITPLLYSDSFVGAFLPWIAGAGAAGAIAAAASSDSSSNQCR